MKALKIFRSVTTWMSRVDRGASSYECNTNPYLATFIMYVFMLMGVMRATVLSDEAFETLDDVYGLMMAQDKGLGLLCLIMCSAETIMLCKSISDMIVRFLIVLVLVNVFYLAGLFVPVLAEIILVIVAVAYLGRGIQILCTARGGMRGLGDDITSNVPE